MRREMLLVPGLTAVLLLAGCGGLSRRDYIAGNRAIVRSLPVFPGATRMGENTGGSNSSGYKTFVIYRTPLVTSGAAVLHFYESRLQRRGWRESGMPLEEDFTRGKARGSLFFFLGPAPPLKHGKPTGRTYSMVVDSRGG